MSIFATCVEKNTGYLTETWLQR